MYHNAPALSQWLRTEYCKDSKYQLDSWTCLLWPAIVYFIIIFAVRIVVTTCECRTPRGTDADIVIIIDPKE
jgi:hypothetical protein